MAVEIRGAPVRRSIGTSAIRILHQNPNRASFTLIADTANTASIYIGYDDPGVTATGTRAGVPLGPGDQISEEPPDVFTGEVYAVAASGTQTITIIEQTRREVAG